LLVRVLGDQCKVKIDGRSWSSFRDCLDEMAAMCRADSENLGDGDGDLDDLVGIEVAMKDPKDVSSESLQFHTDPDASFGRKGKGHQLQLCETVVMSDDKEVKRGSLTVVTYAHVEGAAKSDSRALQPAIVSLAKNGLKPEIMLADTVYGGQDNYQYAADHGIELIAPVPGKEGPPKADKGGDKRSPVELGLDAAPWSTAFAADAADRAEVMEDEPEQSDGEPEKPFRLSDFALDEDGEITSCPLGVGRIDLQTSGGRSLVYFPQPTCSACTRRTGCPVKVSKKLVSLSYGKNELGISIRRAEQKTDRFRELYRWRAGIEGTNSVLVRKGLKRMPVRGHDKMQFRARMKCLGLNINRVFDYARRNSYRTEFY
jgi:hypothetical protein